MAKTLYEGYRIGRNGGERWVGTIKRDASTGKVVKNHQDGSWQPGKTPKGGSVTTHPGKPRASGPKK